MQRRDGCGHRRVQRTPAIGPRPVTGCGCHSVSEHRRRTAHCRNDVALKEELRRALTLSHRHGTTRAAPPSFLAISGGGVEGAFGAGLLVGWSEHGDRPQFSIVTGTSAFALVAPLVFLGREFDWALEKMYTSVTEEEIATKRFIVAALGTDALMDSTPLLRTITKYLDARILQRIAEEYRRGRLLLISTANLDVGKLVIWNIGTIAAS